MEKREIKIADIKIENRQRKELGDIETLAADIERVGLIQPVTVDQNLKLISGERRIRALQHLGAEIVNAIIRPVDTIADAEEIELIENMSRIDLNWDEKCLALERVYEKRSDEMRRLKGKSLSQEEFANYIKRDQSRVSRMLSMAEHIRADPEITRHKTLEDAQKESKKLAEEAAITELKQRHKEKKLVFPPFTEGYLIGNCLEEIAKLESDRYHLAEVDPPYAVELDDLKREGEMDDYNEWSIEAYERDFLTLMREVYRILAPGSHAIVWYGMSNHCITHEIVRKAGFHTPEFPALWYKGATGQTNWPDRTLASSYEPFIYAKKDTAIIAYGKEGRSNVFHFNPVPPRKKWHPTQKPLELMVEILQTFAVPNSDIVVPFLGSGVTLMAADKADMTAFGWDLSENYKYRFLDNVNKVKVDAE